MQNLGFTRSAFRPDHVVLTPDTFVRAPRPGMASATAVVHAAPAMGARFTGYTAEFAPGGSLGPAEGQRFIYVLDGGVDVEALGGGIGGDAHVLGPGGYAYIPEGSEAAVSARATARAIVIEKPYVPRAGVEPPGLVLADERS